MFELLILRIGVGIIMAALLLKFYDQFLKSKYANLFLLQIVIYIAILIVGVSTDVFVSTILRGKWLFFPALINSMMRPLGIELVYSDQLNCLISVIGVVAICTILYSKIRKKKAMIKGTNRIKFFDLTPNVPVFLGSQEFNFMFLWYSLTGILVLWFYYDQLFDLGKFDRRLALSGSLIVAVFEILLTAYFFFTFTEIVEKVRLSDLLFKRDRYEKIYQLAKELEREGTVCVYGRDISQDLLRYVSYGIFQIVGKSDHENVVVGDSILLQLSENARIFFEAEERILSEGIIIGEK